MEFLKRPLRRIVSAVVWKMLRIAGLPRYLETFQTGLWQQGSAHLKDKYADLLPEEHPRHINCFEGRAFSQHSEDGILLYIFSKIGTTNRRFVEFGVESGRECNCANLAINFGWTGLLMDGDAKNVESGNLFYRAMLPESQDAVQMIQCWVTVDNINSVLGENGYEGEIDLLSVDIDGNDYWIWKTINCINPRVVVIEYNATFGQDLSVTVPYDPHFDRLEKSASRFYHGASLRALTKLGNEKGYSLIACDSTGVNAFYLRKDLLDGSFRELSVEEAYLPQYIRQTLGYTQEQQLQLIRDLELVEI